MTWYKLKMPCPITGCKNQTDLITWVCSNDHDQMYVCEQGRLACQTGKHNNLVCNWAFDCGDRTGLHRTRHYLKPDISGLSHALGIGIPLLGVAGAAWISKLMFNIEKQYPKPKE